MFAGSLYLIAKRRREIFFIAKHDIHIGSDAAVDFLGPLLSTDRTPQGIAIIQVIGDDDAVFPRTLHRLNRNFRRSLRKRAEYPAGMKPACAVLAEHHFPIDFTRLQRRHRRVSAVRASQSRAHAESPLGEIQSVANRSADSVIFRPPDQ